MLSRRTPVWRKVVALAPLLLLLVSLPGQVLLRCRLDGILRSACCCPHRNDAPRSTPVVEAQGCCDRQVAVTTRVPADATRPAAPDLATPALAAIADVAAPLLVGGERPPATLRSHGPPRSGPAVILLKHAFLI